MSQLRALAARLAAGLVRLIRFQVRLGIAARLSIAFAAIAILTVAANQIAQRRDSLLRTIEQAPAAATAIEQDAVPEILPSALDQFQRLVLARVESGAERQAAEYVEAAARLEEARQAHFETLAPLLEDAALLGLDGRTAAHVALAAEVIRSAEARRRLTNELVIELAALDERIQASLDRVWTLSGRVAGREYLVQADRVLDEYAKQVAGLSDLHGYGPATVRASTASENALAQILRDNAESLERAFGAEWLRQTGASLDRAVWLRKLLLRTDGQREAVIDEFIASHSALATLIRKTNSEFEAARALANAKRRSTAAIAAASEQDRRSRVRLAWLSAVVLLLLLAITVSTVASVVRPVRRLVTATRRLAAGETGVAVPRGGVKELDTLAVSFNQMAERLSLAQDLAREYHGQLEAKVEERTRQLQHLAAHDPLTRLPNRRQFLLQLNATLARLTADDGRAGVFFLDVDNFKTVNDSMGHVFGDRVLQSVAERLRVAVNGSGFCARLGGDEFTVVCEPARHAGEIELAAERLVHAFQEPLLVDGRELLMGLSVGASVFPEHGRDPETLLRAADAALYHAKAQGRSRVRLFSPELLEAAATRFATEQGLRRAMDRGEFELHFQPEASLATGRVGVVEALLRWKLPDGSHAAPQSFLAVAEESGLIREIGEWVVRATVEHAARWRASAWPDTRLAFNVSSLQLLDRRFVEWLGQALLHHGVPPECIEVELTENVLQTASHTTEMLIDLRELGVGVALDDFGTGYSSLVSLQQLPLTRVKLDRSLIESIDVSARSQAITRAIISLCQSLGLEITAEGVEREEQLAWLIGYATMEVQGYLLSRPVAEADLLTAMIGMPARMEALIQAALPENAVPLARSYPTRLRRRH